MGPVGRNILVSGTGLTVISSLCTPASCSGGSVIDAVSAKVIGTLQTTDGPSALNDNVVLVRTGGDVTTEMALVDIHTGAEQWREKSNDGFGFAYVSEAGSVVVGLSRSGTAQLASIDQRGDARYSGPLPGHSPTLWPELSTDMLATIGEGGPFPGDVGIDGVVHAGVFDLDAWSLTSEAIQIGLGGSQP